MACFELEHSHSLKKPPLHRVLRFGPLRVKMRAESSCIDGSAWEKGWLKKIHQSLHA